MSNPRGDEMKTIAQLAREAAAEMIGGHEGIIHAIPRRWRTHEAENTAAHANMKLHFGEHFENWDRWPWHYANDSGTVPDRCDVPPWASIRCKTLNDSIAACREYQRKYKQHWPASPPIDGVEVLRADDGLRVEPGEVTLDGKLIAGHIPAHAKEKLLAARCAEVAVFLHYFDKESAARIPPAKRPGRKPLDTGPAVEWVLQRQFQVSSKKRPDLRTAAKAAIGEMKAARPSGIRIPGWSTLETELCGASVETVQRDGGWHVRFIVPGKPGKMPTEPIRKLR